MPNFLCSSFGYYEKDENGVRKPKIIEDENQIVTNIKKFLPKMDSAVYVSNGWTVIPREEDEAKFETLKESLRLTGIDFKKFTLLDLSNQNEAGELIKNADFIYMPGGRISCAMDFYNKINLKKLLSNHSGVVMGTSAGAMVQSEKIFDFPEDYNDQFEPTLRDGLGLEKTLIIVPHFDGETKTYQGIADRDVLNDYLLPYSHNFKLTAIPNGSYALSANGKTTLHGNAYEIHKGKITKINSAF